VRPQILEADGHSLPADDVASEGSGSRSAFGRCALELLRALAPGPRAAATNPPGGGPQGGENPICLSSPTPP